MQNTTNALRAIKNGNMMSSKMFFIDFLST